MTPQELKNSILQLAIQGKLVEQRTYEAPICLDGIKLRQTEEWEFDFPETWKLAHIESITEAVPAKQYQILESQVQKDGKYPVISQSKEFTIGYYDDADKLYTHESPVVVFGDHTTEVKLVPFDFVVGADGVKIFSPKINIIIADFLYYVLQFTTYGLNKIGGYSRHYKYIKDKAIPLPPLAEQKRIVAKIEELLPLVERYDAAYTKLEDFNKRFPVDMQKSILQMAIQGKLVEQRAEEGTGEELYRQIQAEKQALIKAGKIKKDKPLPEITDDEKPFDIPEGWKWCRISEVGYTQTGTTPKKTNPEYFGNFIPFLGPGDIQNGIVNYYNQGLSEEGKEYGRSVPKGSVLQVCIGGSIGKCALIDREVTFNQQINSITPVLNDSKYIYYLLNSAYFIETMKDQAGGTATPIINRGLWDMIVIPLPPLAEQKRIVEKLEELLPLCERLKEG